MARLTEQLQRSFIERISRLTRSTRSLRARMRRGFDKAETPVAAPIKDLSVATVQRISRAPVGERIYAIGDIHGRCDLLERLIGQIEEDCADLPAGMKATIIFLGDYIDRGLQSRAVIDFLISDRLERFNTIFLMGNHEEALLRFLDDASFGKQWTRYGGAETLYSYGFNPPNSRASLASHEAMAAAAQAWEKVWTGFRQSIPHDHIEFFQTLRPYHVAGDYLFVHAGMRPNVPLNEQTQRDMLWIRDEFLDDDRPFDHVIVHGHTPTEDIHRDNRRIGLDTGAFISGKLTAVKLQDEQVSFLFTSMV